MSIYIYFAITAQLCIWYGYEPLSDYGVFDCVFRLIPPKYVEPPNADGTIYRPITLDKEIRLLVLEPGAPGVEIHCHLIHVQQSWRTRYEALSYAWGDEAITRQLICSGYPMNVHVGLHDALSDLRHPTRERVLWVDGLCINQADNNEKSKQIMLMSEIYSQSQQVILYLGKSDSSVQQAIESICRLDWKYMFTHLAINHGRKPSHLAVLPIREDKVKWDQIINLLRRPWLRRTWVIQEAVLAPRAQIMCGSQAIPWAKFWRVLMALKHHTQVLNGESMLDVLHGLDLIASTRQAHHSSFMMPDIWLYRRLKFWLWYGEPILDDRTKDDPKLLDLVVEARSFLCKDPRDKIFGMLGLTRQNIVDKYLAPDYTIPVEDVFRKFVLWDIFHNHSLRALGSSSDKAGREYSFPSWVPSFDRLNLHYSLSGRRIRDNLNASFGSSIQAWTSSQDTVLHVKGRVVDTLHIVGENEAEMPSENNKTDVSSTYILHKAMIQEAIAIWLAATKRSTQGQGPVPYVEEILAITQADNEGLAHVPINWEPFLRTLVFDRTGTGRRLHQKSLGGVASLVRLSLLGHCTPEWYLQNHGATAATAYTSFLSLTQSRRFAGTNTGLTGYVPTGATKGDLVCIVYGANVPIILRRQGENRYTLVGECYMHGIMDGEAVKRVEGEDAIFNII